MSETGDITAQVQSMLASGTGEESSPPVEQSAPVETTPVQQTQTEAPPQLNEEFSEFLKNVADPDKPIVQKYLTQVQANVTRQFQKLHQQYEPYKGLGDVNEVQQQLGFLNYLRTPKGQYEAYQALQNQFASLQQVPTLEEEQQPARIPPELQVQMMQQQALLDSMVQRQQQEELQRQQQAEDMQVQETFKNLHTEFGAFDDNYVVAHMLQGMDGAAAVRQFQAMVQEQINQASRAAAAPPILSGGQAAPQPTPKLGVIPNKDVQNFVVEMLNAQNRG